jgi:hypothetical protein
MGLVTMLEQMLSLAVFPDDRDDEAAAREEPPGVDPALPEPVRPGLEPDLEPVRAERASLEETLTTAAVEAGAREQAPPPEATTAHEAGEVPAVSYPVEVGERVEAREGNRLEELNAALTVAESLNLGLHLGLAVERIAHAATRGSEGVDSLKEAVWLIERYIGHVEKQPASTNPF